MKRKLSLALITLVAVSALFLLSSVAVPTASATPFAPDLSNAGYKNPTNTYPYGQCTWFAWGRAYEHGVTMPHYGNAVNWYNNIDYPKSSTPRSDSIAVWSGNTYGHVAYVERVDGDLVYINEANYNTYKKGNTGGGYDGIYKTLTSTTMKARGSYKLKGYIYLPIDSAPTLIRVTGTDQVYHVDINNKKAWVPTANVFNSWKWDWNLIKAISQTQLNAYPDASPSKVVFKDGTFIRYDNDIAIIQGGQKCQFTNWQAYINHGGSPTLKGVYPVDASEWSLNARGPDINN